MNFDAVMSWFFLSCLALLAALLIVPCAYMGVWQYSSQDVYLNKDMCLIAHRIVRVGNDELLVAGEYYPVDPMAPYTLTHYSSFPSAEVGLSVTVKPRLCRGVGPWGWDVSETLEGSYQP